jgi:YYY domain-containing protein
VIDAVLIWLLVSAIGVAALPFVAFFLGRLPTRGLTLAKPLGLLLVAYPLWLLASLGAVPYARWSAIAAIAALLVAGAALWRRSPPFAAGRESLRLWLICEAVFTVAFLGWTLLRSFSPDVWQTEKPMDMAIVNAINRGDSFPPHDPWFSGADLNYYYLGHYVVALLVRAVGLDPTVGFNLAVPLFFALSGTAAYAVAAELYAALGRAGEGPRRSPVFAGLAAAVLAVAVGNVAGGAQLVDGSRDLATYDWWSPSRVIDGTANEFPSFSFLLGDLHAHMLATPFALLSLAFAIQLAIAGPRLPGRRAGRATAAAELALAAVLLGSLYAINSLDFPTAVVLAALALLVWVLGDAGRPRALVWGLAWIALSVLAYLPFWLGYSPTTDGLGIVSEHDHFSRFAADVALIYGLPLWIVAVVFAERMALPFRYLAWAGVALMITLVLLSPPRLAGQALALGVAASALFFAFRSGPGGPAYRMLWVLIGVGVGLIGIGELLYIRDAFDGTASYRFNTVFKAGYQAWFLLAITAACALFWSRGRLRRGLRAAWLVGVTGLVALAVVYPVAGSYARTDAFRRTPTLDGLGWLERRAPGDVAAISWLRANTTGSPVVLETIGRDFDPDGRGRISTFTGLPTVLAWGGHEIQWGRDPDERSVDVGRIYRSTKAGEAARLLARYGVSYVVVGPLERRDYPPSSLAKFDRLGAVAFRSGRTTVYRIARPSGEAQESINR